MKVYLITFLTPLYLKKDNDSIINNCVVPLLRVFEDTVNISSIHWNCIDTDKGFCIVYIIVDDVVSFELLSQRWLKIIDNSKLFNNGYSNPDLKKEQFVCINRLNKELINYKGYIKHLY